MFSVSNLTETVGTDIIAVCPSRGTDIPVLVRFRATAGASPDPQKLYVCSAVGTVENRKKIQAGSTSAELTSPTSSNGDFAAGDLFLAVNRSGGYEVLEIDSITGNDVTWVTGPSEPILTRSLLYAFYRSSGEPEPPFPTFPPSHTVSNITTPFYEIAPSTTLNRVVYQPAGRDPQISGSTDAFDSEGCPMMLILTNNDAASTLDLAEFDWVDRTQSVAKRSGIASEDAERGGTGPIIFPKP